MKDLQDYLERLPSAEFDKLCETIDKKSLNNNSIKFIMDAIAIIYCAEMGVEEAEVSRETMEKLIEDFNVSVSLYKNICIGHMKINKGRMKLTDGNSCLMSLTPEGIAHVENLLKNQ